MEIFLKQGDGAQRDIVVPDQSRSVMNATVSLSSNAVGDKLIVQGSCSETLDDFSPIVNVLTSIANGKMVYDSILEPFARLRFILSAASGSECNVHIVFAG